MYVCLFVYLFMWVTFEQFESSISLNKNYIFIIIIIIIIIIHFCYNPYAS